MTFSVTEASSGASALCEPERAALAGKLFSVVYLDWRMPDMDGMETARAIQALGLEPAPKIILVTALGRDEAIKKARELGIAEVLAMPVSPSFLILSTVAARNEAAELSVLQGKRGLVADNDRLNCFMAVSLLTEAGLEVEEAENGEVAVRKVREGDCDLVFMDMRMPVMDGLSPMREIRRLPRCADLPIIALTVSADDREVGLAAGMDDFIDKPIDAHALSAVLFHWIKAGSAVRAGLRNRE